MANIFTQNPMRVDTVMANDYLTTIGASAGLERPVKLIKVTWETTAAPGAAGPITITDGSAGANVIFERQVPATANINDSQDYPGQIWRNFKLTVIPTNTVVWIHRR